MVQRDGHRTLLADSVERAAELIRLDSSIDQVITEWHISRSTARELYQQCQLITKIDDKGDVIAPPKFLVITTPASDAGKADETVRSQDSLIAMRFADVLEKPLQRLQLLTYLREVQRDRQLPVRGDEEHSPSDTERQMLLNWELAKR